MGTDDTIDQINTSYKNTVTKNNENCNLIHNNWMRPWYRQQSPKRKVGKSTSAYNNIKHSGI